MKENHKQYRWGIGFVGVTFLIMGAWLIQKYGFDNLSGLIGGIRIRWILAALILLIFYWFTEALGLHTALKKFAPFQCFSDTLCAAMIGQFFNCITPFSGGGQPMQAFYLVKKGVPLSFASCSLLIKFIVYQFVMTVYSAVTLTICFQNFCGQISSVGWLCFVGFGINFLVIAGLMCLGFFRKPTEAVLYGSIALAIRLHFISEENRQKAIQKTKEELEQFYCGFAQMKRDIAGIAWMAALTLAQLTALFLIPLCIFYSLGLKQADVLFMVCAAAFVLNFTSFVPLPGAAAGAELGFYTVFGLFFPESLLPFAVLLWRVFTFYLPVLVGGCFTATAGVWGRKGKSKQILS